MKFICLRGEIVISTGLSVCMISKNEEKNITRCVNSVKDVADEVILVDTGSTDKTVEIAKELGVKVLHHKWNNDFSAARNVSIDAATQPWILFLDCDEEMKLDEIKAAKELINRNEPYEAYYLRLVNIIDGVEISDAIVLRMFKNKPEYRFRGKMHEQVINSIQNLHGIEAIGATPIQILHYGYDPQVSDTDKKSKRNLEILLSYDEKDKDGYYYYVLGNEYARVDEYDDALKYYKMSLNVTNAKMYKYIYYPYLAMNIIKVLQTQKKYKEALKYFDEFLEILPDFKDLYFMKCLLHIECSRLTKAKEALVKYINCPKGQYEYPSNNFENYYNISKLMYDLDNGIVDHNEKTLSVWIFMEESHENIIDCIKSINEIAHEIIIVTSSYNNFDTDEITQYGGKILKISKENKEKSFQIAMKNSKGRYILILKPDNICAHVAQGQFMYLLKDDDYEGYYVNEYNIATEETSRSFRLFKNNKKIKSLQDYERYLKLKKQEIMDSKITLHKK